MFYPINFIPDSYAVSGLLQNFEPFVYFNMVSAIITMIASGLLLQRMFSRNICNLFTRTGCHTTTMLCFLSSSAVSIYIPTFYFVTFFQLIVIFC